MLEGAWDEASAEHWEVRDSCTALRAITARLAVCSVRWDVGSGGEGLGGTAQLSLPLSMKAYDARSCARDWAVCMAKQFGCRCKM